MAHMNIFANDAFSMAELTDTINKVPFQPTFIRSLNLFAPRRLRTPFMTIESKGGAISIIQTSERGEPVTRQKRSTKREMRQFQPPRIADSAGMTADEVAGIRAYGSETELMQIQAELADRINGPMGIMRNFELTWEHMQLGAVQGIVLDADGSVLYNWYDLWGISQPAEIDFDLDNANPASGALRKVCNHVIRTVKVAAKGAWVEGSSYLLALCGDAFFDDLTQHPEVRETYLNTQQAGDLRENHKPYSEFRFGGIVWVNYRGTDDGSTVSIGTDKVKFIPMNCPGAFIAGYACGETFGTVNRPGMDIYSRRVLDPEAQGNWDEARFVDIELFSYPMFMCTRPEILLRGKRT